MSKDTRDVTIKAFDPVQPFESVTFTVMAKVPGTDGVPERLPLLESVKPAGSVPLASENVAIPIAPL